MYGKIFASLWHGSMLGQADVQLVFCYLLAHARSDGYVEGHPVEVGTLTGIGPERAEAALGILESPDPLSRTSALDGRRLERVGPGWAWNVVNYSKYRHMRDEEVRREQTRTATRRWRAKVSHGEPAVSHGEPGRAQAEAEAEAEAEKDKPLAPDGAARVGKRRSGKGRGQAERSAFDQVWELYPHYERRSSKAESLRRWLALKPAPQLEDVLAAIRESAVSDDWTRDGGRYVPALEVWIRKRGWLTSDPKPLAVVERSATRGHYNAEGEWIPPLVED